MNKSAIGNHINGLTAREKLVPLLVVPRRVQGLGFMSRLGFRCGLEQLRGWPWLKTSVRVRRFRGDFGVGKKQFHGSTYLRMQAMSSGFHGSPIPPLFKWCVDCECGVSVSVVRVRGACVVT
jgi:hypothetical protein